MQTIHIRIRLTSPGSRVRYAIPLPDQLLQIVCHVLLELADALGTEGMRDSLAFASVLGTVTRIEEATLDRYESIVVFTVTRNPVSKL